MIEIKNKTLGPFQLLVRSKKAPRAFTTLNIRGIGKGDNVVLVEDERIIPEILERGIKTGMITTRYIENKKVKGD